MSYKCEACTNCYCCNNCNFCNNAEMCSNAYIDSLLNYNRARKINLYDSKLIKRRLVYKYL
ncbi:MAG: hypothetical protein IJK61_03735 [Bacteroidetes bacterium]|nr:hypothetical protein [Bacteroidota bacterium]